MRNTHRARRGATGGTEQARATWSRRDSTPQGGLTVNSYNPRVRGYFVPRARMLTPPSGVIEQSRFAKIFLYSIQNFGGCRIGRGCLATLSFFPGRMSLIPPNSLVAPPARRRSGKRLRHE